MVNNFLLLGTGLEDAAFAFFNFDGRRDFGVETILRLLSSWCLEEGQSNQQVFITSHIS